jgi:hypothetical protein
LEGCYEPKAERLYSIAGKERKALTSGVNMFEKRRERVWRYGKGHALNVCFTF